MAAPTIRAMTLAEDLLLLALNPRTGQFYIPADRLGLAMRVSFFADLRMLRRVRLTEDHIEISDPSPTGHDHLDFALTHLQARQTPASAWSWIDRGPSGTAIFRTLAVLSDRGAVRFDRARAGAGGQWSAEVTDLNRRTEAWTRVKKAVGGESAEVSDHALAVLVHTSGLGRHLVHGVRAPLDLWRLARHTRRSARKFDIRPPAGRQRHVVSSGERFPRR